MIVVALERVCRSRVDEPITTKLLCLPDVRTAGEDFARRFAAPTSVEVAILEVMVDPSAFLVVTSTVVGTKVELCVKDASDASDDSVALA